MTNSFFTVTSAASPRTASSSAPPSAKDGSTMFSLSALLATKEAAAPPSRTARAASDGSGLIDLNALAGGHVEVASHIPVLPFGLPARPAAAALEAAPVRSRRLVRAAGLAALLAVGAVMVGLLIPRESSARAATGVGGAFRDAPAALAALVHDAAPPPAAPATAIAPVATTQPAPAATAQKPRTATAGKIPARHVEPAATAGRERSGETQEKQPPAEDPCHGDLMCAMRRATGG